MFPLVQMKVRSRLQEDMACKEKGQRTMYSSLAMILLVVSINVGMHVF